MPGPKAHVASRVAVCVVERLLGLLADGAVGLNAVESVVLLHAAESAATVMAVAQTHSRFMNIFVSLAAGIVWLDFLIQNLIAPAGAKVPSS